MNNLLYGRGLIIKRLAESDLCVQWSGRLYVECGCRLQVLSRAAMNSVRERCSAITSAALTSTGSKLLDRSTAISLRQHRRTANKMQRGLSRRESVLLGLLHIISLVVVASTAPAVDGGRGRRPARLRRSSTAEPTPNDQDNAGPEAVEDAEEICRCAADQWEGVLRSIDRAFYLSGQQPAGQRLRAAELEANTAVHYDYRNGLFASDDFDTGMSTVIDYNMVQTSVVLLREMPLSDKIKKLIWQKLN